MVTEYVALCDMCDAEGVRRFAIAVYWNEAGDEFDTCAEHLHSVMAADLEYEMLDADEVWPGQEAGLRYNE